MLGVMGVVVAVVVAALLVLTVGSPSATPFVLGGGVLASPVPMVIVVGLMRETVALVSESGKAENYSNLRARRCCGEESWRGHTALCKISGALHVRGVGYGMFPQNLAQ